MSFKKQINEIGSFGKNSLMAYFHEIGLMNQDELTTVFSNIAVSQIDDIRLKFTVYTGIGRLSFVEGNFSQAKDMFEQAQKLARIHPDKIQGDYLAFLYYEMSLFYKIVKDTKLYEQLLDKANLHVKSDTFKLILDYHLQKIQTEKEFTTINKLITLSDLFKKEGLYFQYVIGLTQISFIHRKNGEKQIAKDFILLAKEEAIEYKIPYLEDVYDNGLGYWYYANSEYQNALDTFFNALKNVRSNYFKVIILENIAMSYEKIGNYDEAISHMVKANNVASIHNVTSQIPEECLYLGKWYDMYQKMPEQALHYYKLGYDTAVEQVDNGLGFTGPRRRAITEYVEYSQQLNFRKLEGTSITKPFEFALGKKWREIKPIFQYHFIMFQRKRSATSKDFLQKMDLVASTYYTIQKSVNDKGYPVPRLKEITKGIPSKLLVQPLQLYIAEKLSQLSWKDANAKFEKDIFLYLFQQYGFTKKNLGEALDLSVIAVQDKTETLFESSYL